MKFVQIVGFETERLEDMKQVLQEAEQHNAGKPGGPTYRMLLKDRDHPNRYAALLEFESYDEAMRNSDAPETGELAERLGALCIGDRVYTNYDVLESGELK
ncbi:hypothetical protein OHT57_12820 [Streptomyces sp. NBC_00285]|uniref:hypothetical protein n=1 Tax=Streptomyces sp. NBC_00285 TaxID=2975700 RepID=UPI002E27E5FF|nr:hypothetical protein [Streptomyces sp. NBC_00285]